MTPFGSNASAAGAPQAPTQDMQALVSLLGNLMPLLMRIQPQASGQPFQLNPANIMIPNPILDQQAAVSLVEDITADSLRRLSAYLENYAPRQTGLETCVAIVTQAAQSFAMRDYAYTFDLVWQAYRVIAAARMANPQLPSLRDFETMSAASHPSAQFH